MSNPDLTARQAMIASARRFVEASEAAHAETMATGFAEEHPSTGAPKLARQSREKFHLLAMHAAEFLVEVTTMPHDLLSGPDLALLHNATIQATRVMQVYAKILMVLDVVNVKKV